MSLCFHQVLPASAFRERSLEYMDLVFALKMSRLSNAKYSSLFGGWYEYAVNSVCF